MNEPEFYVGYHPSAPPRLGRLIRIAVGALLAGAVALAWLLVSGQGPFQPSRFEFQQYREYRGLFSAWPYPTISTADADYLLVGEGKHGAAALVPHEADGRVVRLRGALAQNGSNRLLELQPGSFGLVDSPPSRRDVLRYRPASLSGEIVDTKCFFGVMNPGSGKVHRDCAARCISGGVPPGLLVRDASGAARVFLLVGRDGVSLGKHLLPYAAEPVTVSGVIARAGSQWILESSPGAIRRE